MTAPWSERSYRAVKLIEEGVPVRKVAHDMGVPVERVRDWWRTRHPGLPIHEPGPNAKLAVFLGAYEIKTRVAMYECPHCGGLIHYVNDDGRGRPWHCQWCGREFL